MSAEVISLLSSSPVRPSPATSFDRAGGRDTHKYHEQPPRVAETRESPAVPSSSSHTPVDPLVGTKRPSCHQPRPRSRDGDAFLFLSDDFDTTGDLDSSFCSKKPRTSRDLSHIGKRDARPARPQGTNSAAVRSPRRESLRPVGVERRSHLVEDIEFSSSPINLLAEGGGKASQILSDPFASSPREHIPQATPRRAASGHPFDSLPKYPNHHGDWSDGKRPVELRRDQLTNANHKTQPSSKATIIDLSSDPIDSSPRPKPQLDPSNARSNVPWDPISSSAPQTHDIQDLLSSPPPTAGKGKGPCPRPKAVAGGCSSDSDGLPDLDNIDFSKIRAAKLPHNSVSCPTAQTSRPTMKKVSKSTEERDREKKQKTEAREIEKERKRIEKERAKEERVLQKEKDKALAEVNKLRTDKKVSTPEMIVDIPASINSGLKVQIEALLSDLNVEHETWNSSVEHVVKWRRKVTSRFNKEMGFWEPIPLRIQEEGHVLVIVQAPDFVRFVLGEEGRDMEAHVLRMKSTFPNTKLIYLIEGLTPWMRKNRNLLNRQFASAVRNLETSAEPGSSSGQRRHRNNNQPEEYIDEDRIEDALLSLQVLHGTLVHHTNASVETATWVTVFTSHISTIPYRKARDASANAGFCMESGQVLTGDGAKDTYIHMLQQIARLTAPIAYGIVSKYESLTALVRGLEEEGPLALAECRKGANKDGALTDRTIGQAMSKRVYKVFLGRDATSTDV
ncbi:ERCC4 domain-containing protein [Xylaria arbuscula]|nr:ERCC4 domain-containing protein [Xylaria arbuscula]